MHSDTPTQATPLAGRPFVARRVVRFAHCDPAGIVFFPRYYELLNSVVEDWWEHLGLPWTGLIGQRRIGMPTAQLDARFVAPSRLGDQSGGAAPDLRRPVQQPHNPPLFV